MDERKAPAVGDVVVYHDERGEPRNAIVTAVWGEKVPCAINVTFASTDAACQDQYGRQICRQSSVSYKSTVHGRYWRFVDDAPVPAQAPAAC